MARRRVEIKPIDDKSKRHTTFTKRRQGLFKKTSDLCMLCGVEAGVITFSKTGNLYVYANPHIDTIMERYLADHHGITSSTSIDTDDNNDDDDDVVPPERHLDHQGDSSCKFTEKIINDTIGKGLPAWESAIGNLGLTELEDLLTTIEKIKSVVVARSREVDVVDSEIFPEDR